MSAALPPPPPGAPGGPPSNGAATASRLWRRFRGLPIWLQVVAWVLVAVVAGSATGAGDRTDRSAVDTVAASATAQAEAAERAAAAEARAAEAEARAAEAEAHAAELDAADRKEAEERAEEERAQEEARRAAAEEAAAEEAAAAATGWTVTYVVDGDTVDVRHTDGTEERVRIVGIDTPERGECGFSEASVAMAALVQGAAVDLVAGARDDRDRYGRILRYVDVEGTDAGLALIEDGLAIARYDSRDGYGRHDREDAYVAADATTPHTCGAQAPATEPAAPPPSSTSGPGSGPNGAWKNCTEAREHGAAPVLRGDPGYGSHLDRDDDGIGCE